MTKADSVHSTPLTNTSAETPIGSPAESAGQLYYPAPVTPEEAFQAIGRLRKDARAEIDRLIQFLDKTDDYVSREVEDQVDDGPCDDDELDGPENGEDEESDPPEPSLGSGAVGEWSTQANWAMKGGGTDDSEHEHDGAEPNDGTASRARTTNLRWAGRKAWPKARAAAAATDDREEGGRARDRPGTMD